MAEPAALSPFAGATLPATHGAAAVAEFAPEACVSVMPFRGRLAAVNAALGFDLPPPLASRDAGEVRALWAGREAWLILGAAGLAERLVSGLAGLAAVADQSDSLAGLALSGADARAVLARLCPLDLDPAVFPDGATARTDIAHLAGHVLRTGGTFAIFVPRSFALHFLHEVEGAMRSVAAQRAL